MFAILRLEIYHPRPTLSQPQTTTALVHRECAIPLELSRRTAPALRRILCENDGELQHGSSLTFANEAIHSKQIQRDGMLAGKLCSQEYIIDPAAGLCQAWQNTATDPGCNIYK